LAGFNRKELVQSFFSTLPREDKAKWLKYRNACDASLFFFVKLIGGSVPKQGGDISEYLHKPICDRLQDKSVKRQAFFAPRGWMKSTIGRWHWIWEYLQDPEIRILVPSEKKETAGKWIRDTGEQISRNDMLRWVYPELRVIDQRYIKTHQWSGDGLLLPRNGIYPEPTISVTGIRGASQGGHFDLITPDDLVGEKGYESPLVLEDARRWFDNIEELLISPDRDSLDGSRIALRGCLTGDSLVTMGDFSFKRIDEVRRGDVVWTMGSDKKAEKRRVELMIPQGKADVWELKTAHQTLRGTGNHPILMEDGAWRGISELKTGDRIVATNCIPGRNQMSELEAWFLGLFVGDGSAIPHNGSYAIAISDGVHQGVRDKTVIAYRSILGREPKLGQHGQWIAWCKEYGKKLERLGLVKSAKEKRIPKEIFRLNRAGRIAFLRGLMDADGCYGPKCRDSAKIEVSNEGLVRDVKNLCSITGLSAGKIQRRTRTIQPPFSPIPVTQTFWAVSVNFVTGLSVRGVNYNFNTERVTSIENIGQEDVYDLVIDGNHNFIANGVVVHNTHWTVGDFGVFVQNEYPEYRWYIIPCLKDSSLSDTENITWLQRDDSVDGESNWPEMFSTKHYSDMRANPMKEVVFWAQHMNCPRDSTTLTKFDGAWLRYYKFEGEGTEQRVVCEDNGESFRLSDFPLWGFIDPGGFAEMKVAQRGSRNAILVGGQPRNSTKKFVIETWAGRIKDPSIFMDKLFDMNARLLVRGWMVETVGSQKYIYRDIQSEKKARGKNLSILELPPDVSKGAKDSDILGLLQPMQNGEIYVHRSMKELISEIREYPNGLTKDLIDMCGKWVKHRTRRGRPDENLNPVRPTVIRADSDDGRSPVAGY
jgi:hypothetical protein